MLLSNVQISNFRSIKGEIDVLLDARIVLVHGENGAGKTSLLSATELALTGRVQFLERADPTYQTQLLHWETQAGFVKLDGDDGTSFGTSFLPEGVKVQHSLSGGRPPTFPRDDFDDDYASSLANQIPNISEWLETKGFSLNPVTAELVVPWQLRSNQLMSKIRSTLEPGI